MAGAKEKFLILEGLDRWEMYSWECGLPRYINADIVGMKSFFWNLKEQTYLALPFYRTKSS